MAKSHWGERLPPIVRLGTKTYQLTASKDDLKRAEVELGTPLYGWGDQKLAEIGLSPEIGEEQARSTLIHEVLHQSLEEAGVRIHEILSEVRNSDEVEERIVRSMAPQVLAFIRFNPELLAWLLAEG